MTDMTSRLADRRCPECGALQSLYVGRSGSKRVWQRGGTDVLPCPGCGLSLRLAEDRRDPNGVKAGILMVLGMGGALAGVLWLVTVLDLGALALGVLLLVVVIAGMLGGMLWNGHAARRRTVEVVREDGT
ncbi:hypothetical protein [Sagittula salina]|uniref:Uncharacterized protein n=1 Tax=Sagittula salina TaxID=2820268 RepID=A0A940MHN7_9RHOB|nr:hypothetical protein [Sagittula salina]MBP0481930.1 hypothetical protein [Sagittula salina]